MVTLMSIDILNILLLKSNKYVRYTNLIIHRVSKKCIYFKLKIIQSKIFFDLQKTNQFKLIQIYH